MIPKKRVPVQVAVIPAFTDKQKVVVIVLADDGAWFEFFPHTGDIVPLPDLPQPE